MDPDDRVIALLTLGGIGLMLVLFSSDSACGQTATVPADAYMRMVSYTHGANVDGALSRLAGEILQAQGAISNQTNVRVNVQFTLGGKPLAAGAQEFLRDEVGRAIRTARADQTWSILARSTRFGQSAGAYKPPTVPPRSIGRRLLSIIPLLGPLLGLLEIGALAGEYIDEMDAYDQQLRDDAQPYVPDVEPILRPPDARQNPLSAGESITPQLWEMMR